MTKNINKLSFWQTVQNEWRDQPLRGFLCHGSKTFQKVYSREGNRADLEVLKREFLRNSKLASSVYEPTPAYNDEEALPLFFIRNRKNFRRVRTNFIAWNIQRLSKRKQRNPSKKSTIVY